MAFDFSKLNFFNRLGARSRVVVLFGAVIGIIFLIYLATKYFSGDDSGTGPSRVAVAPQGLQSIPGGKLSPEYYRVLSQANTQAAEQARISGGSAVPTLINAGQNVSQSGDCNIICSDEQANVKQDLDDWVKQGKISPEVASQLQSLADKNLSVEDYAAELERLVREGKLTPEQARQLLEKYKKQHGNRLLQDSAKMMDDMIKSGGMSIDTANELLKKQKEKMSPADYAAYLQQLVKEGKLSPADAQRLLAQYTQQRSKEIVARSVAGIRKMAREGMMPPDVEKDLIGLEEQMVALDVYSKALEKYVNAGKMIPATATKILDEFKQQKAEMGPNETTNQLLKNAEAEAYGEVNDLLKAGKINQETAAQLTDMLQKDVSIEDQRNAVNQMMQAGKLTPEIAKLKIADFVKVKKLRALSQQLASLQANNASESAYADALKQAVQNGSITPEEAARLMQEYQAMTASQTAAIAPTVSGPGGEEFARLQQRIQETSGAAAPELTAEAAAEFSEAQLRAQQEAAQRQQAQIEVIATNMSSQAQQLVTAWQPVPMEHKEGTPPTEDKVGATGTDAATAAANGALPPGVQSSAPALIKSGTILFAVLDTAVNSDYADSPVMATIVDGKYKGAKLLGKLTTTKSVSGQLDRVMLNFTLMNLEEWPKSKSITAFAVDPDTARTVLASSVNYHYLQKYGAVMATSFLQGYASAITSAGTSTTGIFGTSTSHPELSPSSKIAVALGQIGQNLGSVTQNYVNIPPTVKVEAGVGLGILFMGDVMQ